MFDRILGHVQTNEVGGRIVVLLWKCKFGIHNANSELARSAKRLDMVSALEDEVHASTMLEIRKESNQLNDLLLFHDLNSCEIGLPFFVDRNNAATARDSETRSIPDNVSMVQIIGFRFHLPVIDDTEPSDRFFKGM